MIICKIKLHNLLNWIVFQESNLIWPRNKFTLFIYFLMNNRCTLGRTKDHKRRWREHLCVCSIMITYHCLSVSNRKCTNFIFKSFADNWLSQEPCPLVPITVQRLSGAGRAISLSVLQLNQLTLLQSCSVLGLTLNLSTVEEGSDADPFSFVSFLFFTIFQCFFRLNFPLRLPLATHLYECTQ